MCVNCMDIMTLVHDEKSTPDPQLSQVVLLTAKQFIYNQKKVHATEEELAIFLIVLGSSLLVWEGSSNG